MRVKSTRPSTALGFSVFFVTMLLMLWFTCYYGCRS